jgi:hypothetical protein
MGLSDNIVSMKKISKREMTRRPSQLTAIRPGESIQVEDREGGLMVTRQKRQQVSPAEIEAEIERLTGKGPKLDTLVLMQEGE